MFLKMYHFFAVDTFCSTSAIFMPPLSNRQRAALSKHQASKTDYESLSETISSRHMFFCRIRQVETHRRDVILYAL